MRASLRSLLDKSRRNTGIGGAFFWMGYQDSVAYPLGFGLSLLTPVVQPILFSFVAKLIDSGPSVGDSYFTFAAIGLVAALTMGSALRGFSLELELAIHQGRFETLLVEPISWRFIPFGLAGWPIASSLISAAVLAVAVLALGADIVVTGVPLAIVLLLLGMVASHAVGLAASSLKLLSKRADPILTAYLLAATVLSGSVYPLEILPAPLRAVALLLPQTSVIAAMRQVLMKDTGELYGPSPTQTVLLLVVFMAILYPLALWLYSRSLDYARKMGLLAGY